MVVNATSPGLTGATFTLAATAGAPVLIERTSPTAVLMTALRPSEDMVLTARDQYGNPAPGATVTFTKTGVGALTATDVVSGADGRAVNTIVAPSFIGAATITATATGLTGGPFTFNATTRNVRAAQTIAMKNKQSYSLAVDALNDDDRPDLALQPSPRRRLRLQASPST